jgi:hypothetical protein
MEMTNHLPANLCICTPAPAPYDLYLQSHPKCLAHRQDIQLVAAGWERNGAVWTHPNTRGLWTQEQAYDRMIEERKKEAQ